MPTPVSTIDCELLSADIVAYLDGELPPREAACVASHLAVCAVCRRQADQHRLVDRWLRNYPQRDGRDLAVPDLTARIMARISTRHTETLRHNELRDNRPGVNTHNPACPMPSHTQVCPAHGAATAGSGNPRLLPVPGWSVPEWAIRVAAVLAITALTGMTAYLAHRDDRAAHRWLDVAGDRAALVVISPRLEPNTDGLPNAGPGMAFPDSAAVGPALGQGPGQASDLPPPPALARSAHPNPADIVPPAMHDLDGLRDRFDSDRMRLFTNEQRGPDPLIETVLAREEKMDMRMQHNLGGNPMPGHGGHRDPGMIRMDPADRTTGSDHEAPGMSGL